MKLTLRPEWRLWPINSFLGLLDLKTGVTITLLFAVFNKVAGVYGLISVLAGAGGSFAQLSLYLYSSVGLVALAWGINAVKEENPKHTLYFSHLFFLDHVLSTVWTLFFAVVWWVYTPHDGRRQANSPAQEAIRESANVSHPMTDAQLAAAANILWHEEKGTAVAVIVLSWFAKIYFALLLYSYATHLRKGTYNVIRNFRFHPSSPPGYLPAYTEDEDNEDFYIPSLRTHHPNSTSSNIPDFVSAPGRSGRHSARQSHSSLGKIVIPLQENGDVLFEENGR
ncbi:Inositolphosphorylceramide synthase subunit Kei1-domain-containing protein [Pisolithus microcarpus]|nr:Inositolphosphorylceramide synthase subunit Kei1-domain-containing protein [Pisolithus microcarpus]